MRLFRVVAMRFRSLFGRRRADAELDAEIQFHLEQQIEENIACGMAPDEARHAARRIVGGITQIKEECRDMRAINWIENLVTDVRYAIRVLRQSAGFLTAAVLTLALGIGANTAAFSVIYGVLLRPLPYKTPDRLISVLDTNPREDQRSRLFAGYEDFEEYEKHARTIDQIAAVTWAGNVAAVLSGRGAAKTYLTVPVTANYFTTLGVSAQTGRTFRADDLRGGCAIVLSNKFWRGPMNADPAIIGQALTLDDRPCTVLGVMPDAFASYPLQTEMWRLILPNDVAQKPHYGVFMVARLKPGVSIAQAQAELAALHTALHANDNSDEHQFAPITSGLQDQFTWLAGRNLRTTLAILFAAVVMVLAITCLNVANLLVGRSLARGREFAIRAALGSGGLGLIRQLFAEGAVLSAAGGALGVLVAFVAIRYFVHAQPIELPPGTTISINLTALTFTGLISVTTAVVFAVVPAWVLARGDVHSGLRLTSSSAVPGRQLLSRFLVGAEMAMSVILLAGAGLLMRSVLRFESAPLGFATDNVVASNGSTLPQKTYADSVRRIAFYDELQRKLSGLPGIEAVTVASNLPPYGMGLNTVDVEGKFVPHAAKRHDVGEIAVGPAYFRVLEIPLRHGRVFDQQDRPQSDPVAVVNEALVREYFPDRDPIGQQIRVADEKEWLTIVGVVTNEKRPTVYEEMNWVSQAAVYRPIVQAPPNFFSICLRGSAPQTGSGHEIEEAVASMDAEIAIGDVASMQSRLAPYLKYPRFRAVLLAAFSGLAILLAAVGLYGVLAQFVGQRTREIGIRMAVGARRGDIAGQVAWKGGLPVLGGLVAGFACTLALTRYLASLLYGVNPIDLATFATVAIVMLGAAAFAMILPVWRASRVDPIIALRYE